MKGIGDRRGSALLVAVIVTILLAGVAGAFLAEAVFRAKAHGRAIESEEVQVLCDAALERARLALLQARNLDPAAWNLLLEASQSGAALWTPAEVRSDYLARRNAPPFTTYTGAADALLPALSSASGIRPLLDGDGVALPVFNANIPFRKGAYLVQLRDNQDVSGNGVDDNQDGDAWDADTPAEVAAAVASATVDGDRQIYVTVTATYPDGTQCRIEALVRYPTARWTPPAALLTGGTLSMVGSFSVLGTSGVVHSNEDVVGNGGANAVVAVSVNAAGSAAGFSMRNRPAGGINDSSSNPPVSAVPIPTVDPAVYRNDPTLTPHMIVLDRFGNVTDAAGQPPPAGSYPFSFSNGEWTISGNGTVTPAIYYVEGDFKMTGQGNSDPYVMTILATGSVSLAGNSRFKAFVDPVTGNSTNTLVVAGGDLSLTGTGSGTTVQYQGVCLAHEQAFIKGNYAMEGAVIGENASDRSPVVTTASSIEDTLQGNASVTYNGLTTFVRNPQQAVSVVGLRRLK